MKKETKVLIYSMINNVVIAVAKVVCGAVYGMNSLFADGLHTFSDFITDIISLVGSHISKKRPTREHPFGFGKVEYLTNLFVGMILLLLSIFIIINSFGKEKFIPPINVIWVILVCIILKVICIYFMHEVGSEINSQLLITGSVESKQDVISSIGVIIIAVLLQFESKVPILGYADLIGSIIIGLIILKSALGIITHNSLALIGESETDKKEIDKIDKFLSKYKELKDKDILLMKYGSYYRLHLVIDVDNNLSLKRIINLENKIKKDITRHYSLKIKHVTIYVI